MLCKEIVSIWSMAWNVFSCIGLGRLRWCWQPKLPKPRSCQGCEFRQSLSSKRMWQGRVLAQKQSSSSQKFTRRWSWQLSGWTHRCIVNQAVVWWCSAVRYTVDSTDLCASKFDMSRASTWNTGRQACEASLRRLKTDYIVPRPFKLSCTSSPWILQNHPSSSKMSLITSNYSVWNQHWVFSFFVADDVGQVPGSPCMLNAP